MTIQAPFSVQAQSFSMPGSETRSGSEQVGSEPATSFTPSLRVAERYDSNVFFVRGANVEDYVTTVSPQLKAAHKNQWVQGIIGGGATGEAYVNNPGINYIGANGTVDLNLDRAMNALVPGLRLHASDGIFYTPQPPAFTAPTGGNQVTEAFVQGLKAQRANSFINTGEVEASYFFSPYMGVTATYIDRRIRFGRPIATPAGFTQGRLINVNFQTLTSGLVGTPSPADTISLLHQYQKAAFPDLGQGAGGFSTQGAIARWSRVMTTTLDATVEGGFTVVSSSGNAYPIGRVFLRWEEQYTTVSVSYSRAIVPSMLFASTPLLSQAVTGTVTRKMSQSLFLSMAVNYAVNQSVPDSSLLRFESLSIQPSLSYEIGKTLTATLSYTHSRYEQTFASRSFPFDRDIVQLSLVAQWK